MTLRSIFRDLKARNGVLKQTRDAKSEPANSNLRQNPKETPSPLSSNGLGQQSVWANLPAELLLDIITRVEADETLWPARRAVVSCASVCKSWREATREVVRIPEESGLITFPMSLKQAGPRDSPIQCFIRRERDSSTYRLYLGLSPALSGEASKFLLSAKKIRKATKTDFVISLASNDFSQTSDTYAGKLRSNFFGSKFSILDCRPPCISNKTHNHLSRKRISTKKVLPKLPLCNYNVATISYELNVLRTRGPRRMHCTMHTIPISSIQENGKIPNYDDLDETLSSSANKRKEPASVTENESIDVNREPLSLRNKTPRWHEQLQCWCLNFRGRVTVASVKNFQLVADFNSLSPNNNAIPASEQDRVILQFGKIGKDIFTMDYRYPLSAFQAFAICLSSFDTKPACE